MVAKSKYRKKYTKQLLNGLRKDGLSIEECCQEWGICVSTYKDWTKTHPEFAEAAKIGERDKTAWWLRMHRDVSTGVRTGNAACINFALKNEAGWVDKQEIHTSHDEQITTIRIERIESPKARIIEHEGTKNITDGKSS